MKSGKNNGKTGVFTMEELERYSRQIMVPGIGVEKQELFRDARVCIAGAGGLGSVSAYYLAAAGVGRLRIIDRDRVEPSNLNRQILHFTPDIGQLKVLSALDKLENLNPYCRVEAVQADITDDNVFELIDNSDIIIDALDNIGTRRILNFAAIHRRVREPDGQLGDETFKFRPRGEIHLHRCLPARFGDGKTGAQGFRRLIVS